MQKNFSWSPGMDPPAFNSLLIWNLHPLSAELLHPSLIQRKHQPLVNKRTWDNAYKLHFIIELQQSSFYVQQCSIRLGERVAGGEHPEVYSCRTMFTVTMTSAPVGYCQKTLELPAQQTWARERSVLVGWVGVLKNHLNKRVKSRNGLLCEEKPLG